MESVTKFLDGIAQPTVGAHYIIAFIVLVLLLLTVIILSGVLGGKKQGFNPTATMRRIGQDQQGVGWTSSENRERAEGGPAAAAAPAAAGPQQGSAAWAVLHSDDFACDKREPVGDDAWSWMVGHVGGAGEEARGGRLSDAALSAVAAGHAQPSNKRRGH